MLAGYAIAVNASVQRFCSGWPTLSHSIGLRNIVSSDSRFMKACDSGDVHLVREMMMAGRGRATDIDELGNPALHVSVSKGVLDSQGNWISESNSQRIF